MTKMTECRQLHSRVEISTLPEEEMIQRQMLGTIWSEVSFQKVEEELWKMIIRISTAMHD